MLGGITVVSVLIRGHLIDVGPQKVKTAIGLMRRAEVGIKPHAVGPVDGMRVYCFVISVAGPSRGSHSAEAEKAFLGHASAGVDRPSWEIPGYEKGHGVENSDAGAEVALTGIERAMAAVSSRAVALPSVAHRGPFSTSATTVRDPAVPTITTLGLGLPLKDVVSACKGPLKTQGHSVGPVGVL